MPITHIHNTQQLPVSYQTGKGSVDRTKYGRTRISTKCFYTHHMQQLSKAAVVGDSRQVRRAVTMHKQKAWAARTGGTA